MIAKETSTRKKQDPIPAGMAAAVCYAACDCGTRHDEKFDKDKREVTLIWEVPSSRIDIEKDGVTKSLPRAISQTYTISLHEKASLRKDLQGWRGKPFTETELAGFEIKNILGKPCLLNLVTSNCGKYTNIGGITPLMAGMEAPKQENPSTYFSFDDCKDGVEPVFPEGMPKWLVEKAKESDEYRLIIASMGGGATQEEPDPADEVLDEQTPF